MHEPIREGVRDQVVKEINDGDDISKFSGAGLRILAINALEQEDDKDIQSKTDC